MVLAEDTKRLEARGMPLPFAAIICSILSVTTSECFYQSQLELTGHSSLSSFIVSTNS